MSIDLDNSDDSGPIEGAELLLAAALAYPNRNYPVGYGIARSVEQLKMLKDHVYGEGQGPEFPGVEHAFAVGQAVLIAVTEPFHDNYDYVTGATLTHGAKGPVAEGEPDCGEFFIQLLSPAQSDDGGEVGKALKDEAVQSIMVFAMPATMATARVWLVPPDGDENDADEMDIYPGFSGLQPAVRPAVEEQAIDAHTRMLLEMAVPDKAN